MSCNMNQYVKIISKDQSASWNTKQLYRSEIYFIRKHNQPWSENIKYHFVCVPHVFLKTLPQYLTLYHNIVLRMWRLQ